MTDIDLITEKIIDRSGLDIFKNTRKREYVEARALLIHILTFEFRMGRTAIAEYVTRKGYTLNHTSIVHSLRMYDTYMRFSPAMRNWYRDLDLDGDREAYNMQKKIKQMLPHLLRGDLRDLHKQVNEMYHQAELHNAEVIYEEVKAEEITV